MKRRTRGAVLLAGLTGLLASALLGLAPAQAVPPVLGDESFEEASGIPVLSPDWLEYDSYFDTPICNAACGDGEGSTGPRTGSHWVWFGGVANVAHTQSMSQTFTLNPGVADLSFYLRFGGSAKPHTSVLKVQMDGKVIKKFTEPQKVRGYKLFTFDITKFADGGSHTLTFSYNNGGKHKTLDNWSLDDVSIYVMPHTDADGDTVVDYYDKCDNVSGPSPSGCPTLAHAVTLDYASGKFKGTVTDSACGDAATVKIMKERSGADALVAKVKANGAGAFAVTRSAPAGKYYAVAAKRLLPQSGICPGATSPVLQR